MHKIPNDYKSKTTLKETERAIKIIKDYFEKDLAIKLSLTRVSAPLFVLPETGLNDNLNGIEHPVSFSGTGTQNRTCEIVHSLAKWKRAALKRYNFNVGEGLYTDMNAIRCDEELDNLHSIYVDQWDWEKVISETDRNLDTLKIIVKAIYAAILETEDYINALFNKFSYKLPPEITFITSEELLKLYPNLTAKERENAYAKEKGSIFILQIGGKLSNGERHDGRAPDYDDWSLNGDIIVYNKVLDCAFELSSMGIRVDQKSLDSQLNEFGANDKREFPYHQDVLNNRLPFTVGGGIGQSRLCMFLMEKAHIGEVQVSIWEDEFIQDMNKRGIEIL